MMSASSSICGARDAWATGCRMRTICLDTADAVRDAAGMSEDGVQPVQHAAAGAWSLPKLISLAEAIQHAAAVDQPPKELIELAEAELRRQLETKIWSSRRRDRPAVIAELSARVPWLEELIADIRRNRRIRWPAIIGNILLTLLTDIDVNSIRREPPDRKSRSFRYHVALGAGLGLWFTIMGVWNLLRNNVAFAIIALLVAINTAVIVWLIVIKGYTAKTLSEAGPGTSVSPHASKSTTKSYTVKTLKKAGPRTPVSPKIRNSPRWKARFCLLFVLGAMSTAFAVRSGVHQDWATFITTASIAVFSWIMFAFMARGKEPPNLLS